MKISTLKILKYGCFGVALYYATYMVVCSAIWDMKDIVTEEAMLSNQIASFFMIAAFLVVETIIAKQIKNKKAEEEKIDDPDVFYKS